MVIIIRGTPTSGFVATLENGQEPLFAAEDLEDLGEQLKGLLR